MKYSIADLDLQTAEQAYKQAIVAVGQAQNALATSSGALAALLVLRLHPTAGLVVVALNESRGNEFESVYAMATIRDQSGRLLWQCSKDINGDPAVDANGPHAELIRRANDLFGIADQYRQGHWHSCEQGHASFEDWPFDASAEDKINADRGLLLIPIERRPGNPPATSGIRPQA
ncbi:hypothetical protein AB0B66_10530 [Catellatospora sp. NPDC049111]|uniref:hypothetical protein n=1 Tax=Catellatospora sp. NPDC049111 TaxID=3155271 RepID=UPI00340FB56E